MKKRAYSAGAVKHSFWFLEFRKVVGLRLEGKSWDDIKELNEQENIFQHEFRCRKCRQIIGTKKYNGVKTDGKFRRTAGCHGSGDPETKIPPDQRTGK